MNGPARITTLFLDIGGVLLSNGWDREARKKAVETFGLNADEFKERHSMIYDAHERGEVSLDEYLDRVVFYERRKFTREDFKNFIYEQSQAYPQMLELMGKLKNRLGLRVIAVNNEGRELMLCRIRKFNLANLIDFFVSSCFAGCRKPDPKIFQMALDMSQSLPEQIIYIEDRRMFVEVAQGLGIKGIHHTGYESTKMALASLGLSLD